MRSIILPKMLSMSAHITHIRIDKEIPYAGSRASSDQTLNSSDSTKIMVHNILVGRKESPHFKIKSLNNLTNTEDIRLYYPDGGEVPLSEELKINFAKYIKDAQSFQKNYFIGGFKDYFDCELFAGMLNNGRRDWYNCIDLDTFDRTDFDEGKLQIGDTIMLMNYVDGEEDRDAGFHFAIYIGKGFFLQKLGSHSGFDILNKENMCAIYPGLSMHILRKK